MVNVDLNIAPHILDTLTLQTTKYAVTDCDFILKNDMGNNMTMLRRNVNVCDWPYHKFDSNFEGKMGLHNNQVYAFQGDLFLKCRTSDVTVKKDKNLGCSSATPTTVEELALPQGYFDYTSKKFTEMIKTAELLTLLAEYALYTADFFSYGTNPCLQAMMDSTQVKIFEYQSWYFDEMVEAQRMGHKVHGEDGMKGSKTGKHMKQKKHHGGKKGEEATVIDILSLISNDVNWAALAGQSGAADYKCVKLFLDDWKAPVTQWERPAFYKAFVDESLKLNGKWPQEDGAAKWLYVMLESAYFTTFIMSIVAVFVDGINLDALAELPRFTMAYYRAEVDFGTEQ